MGSREKFKISILDRFRIMMVLLSFVFLAVPFWFPSVRELKGHNLFLTSDSIFLLGIGLLFCLVFERICPRILLRWTENLFRFVRSHFIVLSILFFIISLVILIGINKRILHSFMNSADEHSCYFLAECFRLGRWWVEPHSLSEFFDVVHVGNRDGKWFSVYPFGWPLLMALGLSWNIVDWLNPLLSLVAIFFLFKVGEKLYGFSAAWLGIFFAVLTPYFTFTAASYSSHSTCLLMMSLFSFAYLRWSESRNSMNQMVWGGIAAFAVGYGLATRHLTMAAFAAPFLIYQFWPIIKRKAKLKSADILVIGIIAVFFLIIFYQNYVVTGKFYKAPNRYDKSWERLGFRDFYTPIDGLVFVLARFFYLVDWVPPIFVVLALFAIFQKSRDNKQKLFRLAFLYPVVAYFFYFSWGGNQYGPRYYYEGFPFLMLALADFIRSMWFRSGDSVRKILIAAILFSIGTSSYYFVKHGQYYELASGQRKSLYAFAEQNIREPSVVFIRGFLGQKLVMSTDDAIRNSPALNEKILYARDRGMENILLQKFYPDRKHYLGYYDRGARQPRLEEIQLRTNG